MGLLNLDNGTLSTEKTCCTELEFEIQRDTKKHLIL